MLSRWKKFPIEMGIGDTKAMREAAGNLATERPWLNRFGRSARSLLWLCDDAASDPRWRRRSSAPCNGVNNNRSPTVAKDGMVIVAKSYVRRDHRNVRGAVGADNERKIRYVAGRHAVMAVLGAAGIEVRTGGLEVRRVALGNLMDVDGMLAGRQILDVQCNFDALRTAGKLGSANALAFGVLEFDSHWFAAVRLLSHRGGRQREERTHPT